ncbi:hypothetical protein ACCS79_03525 [Rhizobium johnstonii]|uniref:hypothetical protein n=1 Tax=Rhizobium johnstonii TaxID=3019933 RepID=UPI003F9E1B7A
MNFEQTSYSATPQAKSTFRGDENFMKGRSVRDRALDLRWKTSDDIGVELPVFRTAKLNAVRDVLACDMLACALQDPEQRISYSRDRSVWNKSSRYRDADATYGAVMTVIDGFESAGLFALHDRRKPGQRTVRSSFIPGPMFQVPDAPALKRRRGELIRLKDENKELTDYRDTNVTEAERRFMASINEALSGHTLDLKSPNGIRDGDLIRFAKSCVNLHLTDLYRVFNVVFDRGGRMYGGWWQSVPSAERKRKTSIDGSERVMSYVSIDGRECVEEDYEQLHARMLYRLEGWVLLDDAYTIKHWDRKAMKLAFQVVINALDYDSAVSAVVFKTGMKKEAAVRMIADMKEKHVIIAKHFHSGMGIKMQNLDSRMARAILKEMTIRHDIPCLPIHDSFIVSVEHRDLLVETMKAVYEQVMLDVTEGAAARELILKRFQ